MVDVQILAAPAAGGTPVAAGTLTTIPAPTGLDGGLVTMGSGGLGMHAALAWTRPAQGQAPEEVDVQSLGGDGRALGPPVVQTSSSTAPQIACLSFFSGKNDLTVGYLTQSSTSDPQPSWIALELRDDGSLDGSVTFKLGTANPTCPLSAATTDGYVDRLAERDRKLDRGLRPHEQQRHLEAVRWRRDVRRRRRSAATGRGCAGGRGRLRCGSG